MLKQWQSTFIWICPDGHPADQSKQEADGWKIVAELRSPSAVADRLGVHVSLRSTATHLSDEESHPF